MRTLPSGSLTKPMWQTPESSIPITSAPAARSSDIASCTSATRNAIPFSFGTNCSPCSSGFQNDKVRFGVSISPSAYALLLGQLEHVAVERHRPAHISRRHRHEVDLLDLHRYGCVPSLYGA